jgi:hypothetical protein
MNIKIKYPNNFILYEIVCIYIDNLLYKYQIRGIPAIRYFYLLGKNCSNDAVFVKLGINTEFFMKFYFNIERKGIWPAVNSLELLKKQLKYLEYYNEY